LLSRLATVNPLCVPGLTGFLKPANERVMAWLVLVPLKKRYCIESCLDDVVKVHELICMEAFEHPSFDMSKK
jgi:hypothetical protein